MITEHEMLVTLANMALKMDDLTGHDVVEALRGLGYEWVVAEARELTGDQLVCKECGRRNAMKHQDGSSICSDCATAEVRLSQSTKTVAEMSETEQIERLVRQRNELCRLIDDFVMENESDKLQGGEFLRDEDVPKVSCEIEDGRIVVCVDNVLESLSTLRFNVGLLVEGSEKIIGNTYLVEGRNHQNGELNIEKDRDHDAFKPYVNSNVKPWFGG